MRFFSFLPTSTSLRAWAPCTMRVASLLFLGGISAVSSSAGGRARHSMSTTCTAAASSSSKASSSSASTSTSSPYAHHTYRPRQDLYTPPPAHLTLKQVVIIARHGDRAPIARNVGQAVVDSPETRALWQSKLPSADELEAWSAAYPLSDPSLSPIDQHEHPYAQLTTRGAEELRALGKHLRERYVSQLKWLPAQLHSTTTTDDENDTSSSSSFSFSSCSNDENRPPLVYARATNIRRTQQSCQNLLLGLYPPPSLPPSSSSPPLTINVRPTHLETLYPNADRSCCRQREIISDLRQQHYNLPRSLVLDITQDATARLGLTPPSLPPSTSAAPVLVPWNQVREVWTCHAVHGVPFPSSVEGGREGGDEEEWFERVEEFTSRMWGAWFREKEMTRLAIGPFLKELLEGIEGKAGGRVGGKEGGKEEQVVVYAGHDSSIVPVLAALGIWEDVWPPYAANVVLELAEKEAGREGGGEGEHFVRVLYNDEERVLFGGGEGGEGGEVWYALEEFAEKVRRFVPEDMEKECKCRNMEEGKEGGKEEGVASSIK